MTTTLWGKHVVTGVAIIISMALLVTGCSADTSSNSHSVGHSVSPVSQRDGDARSNAARESTPQKDTEGDIWFDAEPTDPLDKLVYRSQRFIGKPLTLRTLEGEDLTEVFKGKPDLCDPQFVKRLGEIGIKPTPHLWEKTPLLLTCSLWEYPEDVATYIISRNYQAGDISEAAYQKLGEGLYNLNPVFEQLCCVTTGYVAPDMFEYFAIGDMGISRREDQCQKALKIRQIFKNIQGGTLHMYTEGEPE
ncbi:hypothetical protein GC425_00400 [Corynebacterium sp. zg254]|uniref:Uncharacterized protein n=1 Tax=Corynebacterium zhongnanshanii TaxID=2768834 RepID=A0ABQ6VGH2_9CORY|nr:MULTISPECIES: hypothetical protein [Corynebacterium]KAB3523514.1 hypothetical protein F8377_05230 [Corynebacterium zhongnanshanii]MCR5913336.1 hypothetical protein [Corynebacterium sp. zg254]